jgi:hypothetical protein
MAERAGKTLANYIGSFVEYDKNNKGSFWREYMRIKVRVDVRQPLKKDSRVKNQGGAWCTVNFKYERLGVFCFVCGILSHSENRCAVRFSMEDDDGSRAWTKDLRAEPRRRGGRQTSRWLMEDGGGRPSPEERQSRSHVSSGEQVDLTRSNIPPAFPNQNRQNINQHLSLDPTPASSLTHDQSDLSITIVQQPINGPANSDHMEYINDRSIILNQPMSQQTNPLNQPSHAFNVPDNYINSQSLTNNNQPITSLTFPPIVTPALNQKFPHQFSFNANSVTTIKQNPNTRLIKNNPTHKQIRNGPTRTGPKPDPPKPSANPDQNTAAPMEFQTEKKRRRDEEKETTDNSTIIQHFLAAGPGSQACRDQ